MSNSIKEKLHIDWRSLMAGAVLGSLICIIPSAIANNSWSWRWADWTGFGGDTITKKSIERTGGEAGPISKVTFTDEPQPEKTLWDFLGLVGVWAVPILLFYLGNQLQQKGREIAAANLRDEALRAYIDSLAELLLDKAHRAELLLNKESSDSDSNNPAQNVARIRTVTILRRLQGDTERQRRVLDFLRDAELLKFILKDINLEGANLEGVNLRGANLEGVNLRGATLEGATLMGANLESANLAEANLESANLAEANLKGANLQRTNLQRTNLEGANLLIANLLKANLEGAYLLDTNLAEANLAEANLERANLSAFQEVLLKGANLEGANLERANLTRANLEGANLKRARNLTVPQVQAANNWKQARYSPEFRQQLGLPPETSENNEGKS